MEFQETESFIEDDVTIAGQNEKVEKENPEGKQAPSCCRKICYIVFFAVLFIVKGTAIAFFIIQLSSANDGNQVSNEDFMTPELMRDVNEVVNNQKVTTTSASTEPSSHSTEYWQYEDDEYEYADEDDDVDGEKTIEEPDEIPFLLEKLDQIFLEKIFPVQVDTFFDTLFGNEKFLTTMLEGRNAYDIHISLWEAGQNQFRGHTVRKYDCKIQSARGLLETSVVQVRYKDSVSSIKYTVDAFKSMTGAPYSTDFYDVVRWQMVATSDEKTHVRASWHIKWKAEPWGFIKNKIEEKVEEKMKNNIQSLAEKLTEIFSS